MVTTKARAALDDGQRWLAAGAVGTWRHRGHVAFVSLQRRIDAREEALGLVQAFVQRAEDEERRIERMEREAEEMAAQTGQMAAQAAESSADAASPVGTAVVPSSSTSAAAAAAASPSLTPAPPASTFVLTLLYPSSVPAASVRAYLQTFSPIAVASTRAAC